MNNIVKEVLNIINENGFEAYLVGGYPRDLLLNIKTEDFDICTNAKKEDLEKIFNTSFVSNFGSIILEYKEEKFEITTYRKEISYSGIRTPDIVYTSKLEDDIVRRDFTINAICMNADGKIIDLVGGCKDIKNKIIKSIGNANLKLSEDPLRILRAIRLACLLNFDIEEELSIAIKNNNHRVKELSYFRKKQELDKIFSSENLNKGLKLLKDYMLFDFLDIEVDKVVKSSILGVWAQIQYSNKYSFTKKDNDIIQKVRKIILKKEISNYDLYFYGLDASIIAGEILNLEIEDIKKRYSLLIIKNINEINISYDEINKYTKMKISDVYKILEYEIVNNNLENNKKDIINYISKLNIYNIDK